MNNKKTVRQLVQEILIQNQNSSLSAKDVYDLISNPEVVDELGEITEHPTYGKHTLGFNSIRNALHNLYLENWFNADKNFDGTRNTYYNIYTPYSVETFEHSTNVIEDEYQRYLTTYNKTDNRPKQNVEINNDEYDDNETCCQ